MQYLSYHRSIDKLDFTADRMLEVLEATESTTVMEMDPKHMDEARHLLELSEFEIERFSDLEHHEVKDYHVWSIKKPQLQNEIADQLMSDREVLKDATNQLQDTLERMKGLQEHIQQVHASYVGFVERMQDAMQGMESEQMTADFSVDVVQRDVLPVLERLMLKLDKTIAEFEKELAGRLDRLHDLGRQIAWLRGGSAPIRAKDPDDELPPEEDQTEEGPTQAEALLDHQDEQLEDFDVGDLDRGRKDERTKRRGGGGRS